MKKYLGDKAFYKVVLGMAIPMVIQQGITNFVSLIDNIMVGRLGTEAIASVAIVNQIMFVFAITVFGCIAGASIHGAQYYGTKDHEGVRYTFRYRLLLSFIVAIVAIGIFIFAGTPIIHKFLNDSAEDVGNLALTLEYCQDYLNIMMVGMIPFAFSQAISSALRDTGETVIPMKASILAVSSNFILNLLLIFGLLGFPKLGVCGAAIATVISRYLEMVYMLVKSIKHSDRFIFIQKAFRSMYIPKSVFKKVTITSIPLIVNEFLWSLGQAFLTQSYSLRGLAVVTAFNISNTVSNLFFIICLAMGNVVSIMVGQLLGAGQIEEAKDTDQKLLFFVVMANVLVMLVILATAPFIPYLYDIEPQIRRMATRFLFVYAVFLPVVAFNHGAYFTMRSGGKSFITFLFDSVFSWTIMIPVAYVLTRYTDWNIILIYACVTGCEIIKSFIGFPMVRSGVWATNLVKKEKEVKQ